MQGQWIPLAVYAAIAALLVFGWGVGVCLVRVFPVTVVLLLFAVFTAAMGMVFHSFYRCHTTPSDAISITQLALLKEPRSEGDDEPFCEYCQQPKPPRVHHCSATNRFVVAVLTHQVRVLLRPLLRRRQQQSRATQHAVFLPLLLLHGTDEFLLLLRVGGSSLFH